jgi:hypothetical protein
METNNEIYNAVLQIDTVFDPTAVARVRDRMAFLDEGLGDRVAVLDNGRVHVYEVTAKQMHRIRIAIGLACAQMLEPTLHAVGANLEKQG